MIIPLTRQPVVSTANIAQLAVDLLIASLSLRVIGVFDSRDLVPVVGGREDEEEGVSTPLECELSTSSWNSFSNPPLLPP
jgi:proteasome assembly chaperone 2